MAHTGVPGGRGAARTSPPPDILLADDENDTAEALAAVLRAAGYSVRLARHGGEALALAAAAVPDLIISDVMMPEMDGFMLCRRIREDRRLAGVPVILYSSVFCFDDDRELAMSLGASRFLVRPIAPGTLLEAVRAETRPANRPPPAAADAAALKERHYRALLEKLHLKIKELEAARLELAASEERRALAGAALLQSQKMEVAGRLASGIAHDFNNILTAITGYAELALPLLPAGSPARGNLEEIGRSAGRAAQLTRQLLAFSRRQVLEFRTLDLNAVVADMRDMLERLIGEDIALAIRPAAGPARVRADFGRLEQVVLNLAVNARDAMPAGGKLAMEIGVSVLGQPAPHRHGTVPPGRYATLTVTDTGCGMSEEAQSHLFEPFFTTKERGKGTGLGLPTIYGIVTQSGGHVSVCSEEGKGACFRIYLPEAPAAAEPSQPAETRKPVLFKGTATILLVEDDPSIRTLGRRVLAADGFSVVHAASGPEALALCEKRQDPVHLLLTDMVMPEMSGPELAARLAGRWPGLKVAFMSGYTEHAALDDGLLMEGAAFIQKPFAPDALLRAVRETLAGPRVIPRGNATRYL